MSNYIYKPQTYFEFKREFMDKFGNSDNYYLGQSFCLRFIPQPHCHTAEDNVVNQLWYSVDNADVENLIFKFIYDNNWDYLELYPVKNVY